jgi:hemolysin activation/secretion protein
MKYLWIAALLAAAGTVRGQAPDANVNERYTVESVEITGADQSRLDRTTRDDLHKLVGQKLSQERIDELCQALHKAFPGHTVGITVRRGTRPEHVKITFEVKGRSRRFDISAPVAVYHAKLGWSGALDAAMQMRSSTVHAGVVSDGEGLVERFAGVRAGYENRKVGSDRLSFSFDFGTYHQVWNGATAQASANGSEGGLPLDIYRTRTAFQPVAAVELGHGLKLSVGTSFQQMQFQFPAARTEAANAVITTLRYDRLLEESGPSKQRLEAGYGLRAATRALGSDFAYNRHTADFGYTLWHGNHKVTERFVAGGITGNAPLFERFVLGNSTTLRGWNKYDLVPLGGNRMVYNSVEYRYRAFQVFYDTGAVWLAGRDASPKHAAGAGVHIGDLALLIAFPIRNGRVEPVFIAGLNL